MKNISFVLLAFGLLFFLDSCSVDKRLYRPGYHVEWGVKKPRELTNNTSAGDAKSTEDVVVSNGEEETVCITIADSSSLQGATMLESGDQDKELKRSAKKWAHQKEKVNVDDRNEKRFELGSSAKLETADLENGGVEYDKPKKDGFAVASFVLGIVGFLFFPCFLLALIFGIIALNRIKADPENVGGQGLAIAGLVLGIVGVLLVILAFVILFEFLALAA